MKGPEGSDDQGKASLREVSCNARLFDEYRTQPPLIAMISSNSDQRLERSYSAAQPRSLRQSLNTQYSTDHPPAYQKQSPS